MIGTVGTAIVAAAYILFACLVGIAAGGLICVISRRTWTAKARRSRADSAR